MIMSGQLQTQCNANNTGRPDSNPILDVSINEVLFPGDKVIIVNVIVEQYMHCVKTFI